MPSYIGSSLEFTKNNLTQIVGVKEANIEVVEVSTAPEGTTAGTVVSQDPKPGEKVDLNKTRVKISIYKPKPLPSSSSSSQHGNSGTDTTPSQSNNQGSNSTTDSSDGSRTSNNERN